MTVNREHYLGNPNLKKTRVPIEWSREQVEEYIKCSKDPIYFAEKYIKIVHVDHGLIPIELYDYQKEIIEKITNNRRVAVLTSRQAGKCQTGDTVIKIRNKKTKEIIEIDMETFHEIVKFKSMIGEHLKTQRKF